MSAPKLPPGPFMVRPPHAAAAWRVRFLRGPLAELYEALPWRAPTKERGEEVKP